jgi:type IV pilus assembly protein PilV
MTYIDALSDCSPTTIPRRRRAQCGASLIEVLVSMLILAVGLLGFAGMQMVGIKSNHSAQMRSQATLLAYDLADRMRGARDAALDGDYDDDAPGADRLAWNAEVARRLGADASPRVTRNDAVVTIEILWNDRRGDARQHASADDEDPDAGGGTTPADPDVAITQEQPAPDEAEPEAPSAEGDAPDADDIRFAYTTEI